MGAASMARRGGGRAERAGSRSLRAVASPRDTSLSGTRIDSCALKGSDFSLLHLNEAVPRSTEATDYGGLAATQTQRVPNTAYIGSTD